MTDEQMAAWLRSYAKFAVYLSDEERINAMADRIEALCRAIEQHEAFKQEVSDVMTYIKALYPTLPRNFNRFIIPKPDPLVEDFGHDLAADIRAAIEKRGGRVVWGEG